MHTKKTTTERCEEEEKNNEKPAHTHANQEMCIELEWKDNGDWRLDRVDAKEWCALWPINAYERNQLDNKNIY